MESIKHRYSRQRETILQVLRGTLEHPNADWIYNKTRRIIPNISLGTVYRNLSQLVESGRIIRIKDDAVIRYDANIKHHDHFRCTSCGRWYDIEILDNTVIESFNKKHKFHIEAFNLELEGVCEICL
ncbi:transcriptional repressor [bacterium]|nr:transcriptional repressor [bacterium]